MKQLKLFGIIVFALVWSLGLNGQEEEGRLKMEIVEVDSNDPQVAAQMEMLKGSELIVNYKGDESMTTVNMMGGMIRTDIKKSSNGDMDMFMDMMGNKMWIPSTKSELDLMKAESGTGDYDIEYDTEDRKEIAGYDCYKMILTSPDNADMKLTAYITEDLKINAAVIQNVDISEFKGFPLEYSLDMGIVKMTFSTLDIEDKIDASAFEINTSSYKKMTMEEFQSQMGGMGGGFGF